MKGLILEGNCKSPSFWFQFVSFFYRAKLNYSNIQIDINKLIHYPLIFQQSSIYLYIVHEHKHSIRLPHEHDPAFQIFFSLLVSGLLRKFLNLVHLFSFLVCILLSNMRSTTATARGWRCGSRRNLQHRGGYRSRSEDGSGPWWW